MPTIIDERYWLKEKNIGNGNMASVHLCVDLKAKDGENDLVVIKEFDKPSVGNANLQKQVFEREVEALKRANNKNVVQILGWGNIEEENIFYIVLEYIKGKTFEELYDELCKYEYYQKLELMESVVNAIEYLHKKEIVHRDLKPSNIMIDDNNEIKIIDFGISKVEDTFYNGYTLAGFNTKRYAAPEQLLGKNITYQSDIFSLGLIFYEIFGEKIGDNRDAIDFSILDSGIKSIISKMLNEELDLRYKSISEVKKDIQREKSQLVQEKFINIGFVNTIVRRLYHSGYIKKEEAALATILLKDELSGKCYIKAHKDRDTKKYDGSYELYGKQFILILKVDNEDKSRFTIIGVRFVDVTVLLAQKEWAYEIPYRIEINKNPQRIKTSNQLDVQELIDEIFSYEEKQLERKNKELKRKNITNKWKEILALERKKLNQEKSAVAYKNLKINEEDESLEVEIKNVMEVNFSQEDMLQMTTKQNIYRQINVGYMREISGNKMIIDIASQVDLSNIARSGEISINMKMAEISLNRQSRALKSIQFKENANPTISDIIFDPKNAKSQNNIILKKEDCRSNLIDESKLESLEKVLSARDIFLLQGPPGTGKTTFISELVYQILYGNKNIKGNPDAKILIASQSHVAVDHSLSKIRELVPNIKMIRIGVLDKMSKKSRNYTLDVFCRKWTEEVIENCKNALISYKKEIKIDETIQEKNSILNEIENLSEEVKNLSIEIKKIKNELDKIEILDNKWNFVNEQIANMKQMISDKTSKITDIELNRIIDDFTVNLQTINNKLKDVIDDSIEIIEQKEKLEEQYIIVDDEIKDKQKNIKEKEKSLKISNQEDYQKVKKEINISMKENTKKYAKFSKVEKLCSEWQRRVIQGEGLLQESISDATLVGATCLGIAGLSDNIDFKFDWVIVDEAGKATPTEILVPICQGKKIVLVGDHKQLPPVVDETLLELQDKEKRNITKQDLEESLFEYLEKRLGDDCKNILNKQYRMNPVIGNLISEMFYEGRLISKTTMEEKTIPLNMYDNKPLVWLTTATNPNKKEERITDTYRNTCEANIIFDQLIKVDKELERLQLSKKKEVAIIAGYRGQKDILKKLWESKYSQRFRNISVEINTVDAFQGREADIVFYSIVRSNEKGTLGFLKDIRRLNVAFSRAKELLVVVGDHLCAQKNTEIAGQVNPFVGIMEYIYKHKDTCMLKEV